MSRALGVCSWSLQPNTPADLAKKVRACGLTYVQLALDSLGEAGWPVDQTLRELRDAGIEIRSGMMRTRGEDYSTLETIRRTGGVRPDEHWAWNLANARRIANLAGNIIGTKLVTLHAGFLPESGDDEIRPVMIRRLRTLIDVFGEQGVTVGFETGQETADTLLGVFAELDRPTCGVNFDPANMILYDHGDPIESLRKLGPHVLQIHIKDAVRTTTPGKWGMEVPVGAGEVDWPAFFGVMQECGIDCDLMIEREAGGKRIDEIRAAAEFVGQTCVQV